MSNSVRPHRRQPTRLCHPWDSLGKNTGVGCHFLLQCMKVKSESEVAQSCPTLRNPMDCSLPGSSVHGIFQARVLEWVAIAFSWNSVNSSFAFWNFGDFFSLTIFDQWSVESADAGAVDTGGLLYSTVFPLSSNLWHLFPIPLSQLMTLLSLVTEKHEF